MTVPIITPDITDKSIAKELCEIPMEGSKSNWNSLMSWCKNKSGERFASANAEKVLTSQKGGVQVW